MITICIKGTTKVASMEGDTRTIPLVPLHESNGFTICEAFDQDIGKVRDWYWETFHVEYDDLPTGAVVFYREIERRKRR